MTIKELSELTGESIQDTEYTIGIILKQIKPDFVITAIKAELKDVEEKISILYTHGDIIYRNGTYHAVYNPEDNHSNFSEANKLLYQRNRLMHILYHN